MPAKIRSWFAKTTFEQGGVFIAPRLVFPITGLSYVVALYKNKELYSNRDIQGMFHVSEQPTCLALLFGFNFEGI